MTLIPDEIADLGRWYFVQFADEMAAEAALAHYRRFLERQREAYRIADHKRTKSAPDRLAPSDEKLEERPDGASARSTPCGGGGSGAVTERPAADVHCRRHLWE